jgi:hypothetical protein
MKTCSKCRVEKDLHEFHNCSKSKDLHKSRCKSCIKIEKREYIKNNKDKILQYKLLNKDKIAQWYKEYQLKNKEKISEYLKIYRISYDLKNKDKILQQKLKQIKIRYQQDPLFRLKTILRRRFYTAIKYNKKDESIINLLGCTIEELKNYLEAQFKPGMNWQNHGIKGWHIDHIKPCSSFDLSKPEEQRKCFHYTNLQPLWAEENLRKSDTIIK